MGTALSRWRPIQANAEASGISRVAKIPAALRVEASAGDQRVRAAASALRWLLAPRLSLQSR